jgi:predicted DNA-binding protein
MNDWLETECIGTVADGNCGPGLDLTIYYACYSNMYRSNYDGDGQRDGVKAIVPSDDSHAFAQLSSLSVDGGYTSVDVGYMDETSTEPTKPFKRIAFSGPGGKKVVYLIHGIEDYTPTDDTTTYAPQFGGAACTGNTIGTGTPASTHGAMKYYGNVVGHIMDWVASPPPIVMYHEFDTSLLTSAFFSSAFFGCGSRRSLEEKSESDSLSPDMLKFKRRLKETCRTESKQPKSYIARESVETYIEDMTGIYKTEKKAAFIAARSPKIGKPAKLIASRVVGTPEDETLQAKRRLAPRAD